MDQGTKEAEQAAVEPPTQDSKAGSQSAETDSGLKVVRAEQTLSLEDTLQSRIKILQDLVKEVQGLRSVPGQLLKWWPGDLPQQLQALNVQLTNTPEQNFKRIPAVRDHFLKAESQASLKAARESEARDGSGILPPARRDIRSKKRAVLAESPSPFPVFLAKSAHVFPTEHGGSSGTTARGLPSFVRATNSTLGHGMSVKIWSSGARSPGKAQTAENPIILRVWIRDVVTVYVKLVHEDVEHDPLRVESVAAFGPREKKGPHSHSDFGVYQKLSQQITRMVEYEPKVSIGQLMELLWSYNGLFVTRCFVCERVLSQEGHVPPVVREWREGRWEARHGGCGQ
ncbi:hypothetical protein BD410DRAFT_784079 [Rickenella mellea]|uniref:Mediator complex subunit 27 n=1 Tax=Rickenella mellea TaxID=50990 RepID=A0A4Y7QEJ3_9AGAM|nr:hypothetical protein BD410DRAFT_784079 [Rickenella mellea]